jgi:hypothetical protein
MSEQEHTEFTPVGEIVVQMSGETGEMLFVYRQLNPETRRWAFCWGLWDSSVAVLELDEGKDLNRAISVGAIPFPDEWDNTSAVPLGAIAWMAEDWILEKEVEG